MKISSPRWVRAMATVALCLFASVQRSLEEVPYIQSNFSSQGIQETNQPPYNLLYDARVSVEKHIKLSLDGCWFYLWLVQKTAEATRPNSEIKKILSAVNFIKTVGHLAILHGNKTKVDLVFKQASLLCMYIMWCFCELAFFKRNFHKKRKKIWIKTWSIITQHESWVQNPQL